MHSSRICTARLLPVSLSMHCAGGEVSASQGVSPSRGVSAPGGVSQHALRQIPPLCTSFAGGNNTFTEAKANVLVFRYSTSLVSV